MDLTLKSLSIKVFEIEFEFSLSLSCLRLLVSLALYSAVTVHDDADTDSSVLLFYL